MRIDVGGGTTSALGVGGHARRARGDRGRSTGATAPRRRVAGEGRNVNGVERVLSLAAGRRARRATRSSGKDCGAGLGVAGGALVERGVTGHCVVYGALGVSTRRRRAPVRQHGGAARVDANKAQKIERAVTIFGRSADELYAFWRKLENLPRIFQHLESVTSTTSGARAGWPRRPPAARSSGRRRS